MNTRAKTPTTAPLRAPVRGNTPAFPHPARADLGISYRAWLAVHAPKNIPEWFLPNSNQMPVTVKPWHERPEAASLTEDQVAYLRSWAADPIFDLQAEYAWAQKAHNEWLTEQAQRKEHAMLTRYFTWPFHWADMMIRAEDQTAQGNLMAEQMEKILAEQQKAAAEKGAQVLPQ